MLRLVSYAQNTNLVPVHLINKSRKMCAKNNFGALKMISQRKFPQWKHSSLKTEKWSGRDTLKNLKSDSAKSLEVAGSLEGAFEMRGRVMLQRQLKCCQMANAPNS